MTKEKMAQIQTLAGLLYQFQPKAYKSVSAPAREAAKLLDGPVDDLLHFENAVQVELDKAVARVEDIDALLGALVKARMEATLAAKNATTMREEAREEAPAQEQPAPTEAVA